MRQGTVADPFDTTEAMKLARCALRWRFEGGDVLEFCGDLFEWRGGRWEMRPQTWLEDQLWLWLEDRYVGKVGRDGLVAATRLQPTRSMVENVGRALRALVRRGETKCPLWLEGSGGDPARTVAFEDVLVDVGESVAQGEWVVRDRDRRWFDTMVVPCRFDPDAREPERWFKALTEWSQDDAEWVTLLQRWMGYCLMSYRGYAKWMLFHGKTRAGKGTIVGVVKRMLGHPVFKGMSLEDLSDGHGLAGLQHCRVLSIGEVSRMHEREQEKAVQVLKGMVGQDPGQINEKFKPIIQNVVIPAAPMMQANEIPLLPNRQRGFSAKMLVLPFTVSFEGREEFGLAERLAEELPGIALWAMHGAVELEQAKSSAEKFPMPVRSAGVVQAFHLANNPFDHFLQARFVKAAEGFVSSRLLVRQWKDWSAKMGFRRRIPDNQFTIRLCEESSWDLIRKRRGHEGERGVLGLAVRREPDDET